MGVTGLWRLVEPSGKPVPVETLENKVLAVDISIWLHQVVKGYQDARGAPLPNAHLMGLFQRLCKLLYFRIKPVFVFDGAFPDLKKETIAKRQDSKSKYHSESERLKRELALLLSKKTAIGSLLGKELSPKKAPRPDPNPAHQDDLFKLPELPEKVEDTESESDEDTSDGPVVDLHSVDLDSDNFKKMEVKEKYELLVELKETRKMNSWGKLHELPKKSDNFSNFQMQRLLKRRKLQECLEETEKQMSSDGMSLNDLEVLLNEEGIDTKLDTLPTRRIASSDSTRYILINNVKQALAEAKKRKLEAIKEENKPSTSKNEEQTKLEDFAKPKTPEQKQDELDEDLERAIQMSLECADDVNNSNIPEPNTDESWSTLMSDTDSDQSEFASDSEEKDGYEQPDLTTAKSYIMQYCDYTHKAIEDIVKINKKNPKKTKLMNVDKILDDLNKEKSIIADEVELSSDEDCNNETKYKDVVINLDSTQEETEASIATQASVICLGEAKNEIVSLDTSLDDITEMSTQTNLVSYNKAIEKSPELKNATEEISDSNESDFEEVTDNISNTPHPIIELTLNMPNTIPEDDIFADIFTDNKLKSPVKLKEENEDHCVAVCELDNSDITMSILKNKTEETAKQTSSEPISQSNIEFEETKRPNDSKLVTDSAEVHSKKSSNRISVVNACLSHENSYISSDKNVSSKNEINVNEKTIATESSAVNIQRAPKETLSTEKLNEMVKNIQHEEDNLIQEKGRLDRIGRNITEQMTKDAQELLQIFGIPYIVAPMEAEAQCAFLESVNLTDGTITDDSDIWLFGGRTVYKNFFNQKKHVLQFLAERIEKSFNLTREQLILLAMLVGSDYTTGIQGVGPVTALEILAAFPHSKRLSEESKQARYNSIVAGLQEFKRWVRAGKRTDNNSLKKKLKNVQVTDDFPSVRVVQAYLEPNVEKNEDKFTWGELDITVLRDYTKTKFGWSQNKLDEIMKPVISRLQSRNAQKSLQDYFKRKIEFHSLEDQVSKRVMAAIQKMGPEGQKEVATSQQPEKQTKKRKKEKITEKNTTSANITEAGPSRENTSKSPKKLKLNPNLPKELSTVVAKVQKLKEEKLLVVKNVRKLQKSEEVIPQREKDKRSLLENKLKAIEMFRKTRIDTKSKATKRKPNLPKDKADLSESDSD